MAGEIGDRAAGIPWYRTHVDRDVLRGLTQRSDARAWLQTGGFLGLLAVTGTAAYLAAGRLPWPAVLLLILVHGTFWQFLLNGFHELCHQTVFRTRWLNAFFVRVFGLLGCHNVHLFTGSHMRHHQYTLHPPQDLEVVLPIKLSLRGFLRNALIDPLVFKYSYGAALRLSAGRLCGEWDLRVFPESDPEARRQVFRFARLTLAFHVALLAVSIHFRLWMLPVLTTFAPFYGGWLLYLLNNTQHVGLQDNVNDFRLCCRTILINPFLRFLYWHMNYHIEHHMYAAVPCYHLRRLHEAIKHELPPCPRGVVETWTGIGATLQRQRTEPGYQFAAPLPGHDG
jgi:fatty acid desaturase